MSIIWKNGKYQPLIRYVTNKDFKLLSNLVNIINGDSNTKGSFRKIIKDLIGGAPEAYDTLKEIADKLKNNDDLYTAISNTIATKATTAALNEEITRAKTAEASITSDVTEKLAQKADTTVLNDYVLTTALNQQIDMLKASIDAKQPKGNYLTEHQSLEEYAKKSEIAEQIAAKADVTALTALEARIAALEAKHTETNTQIEA